MSCFHFYPKAFAAFCLLLLACISGEEEVVGIVTTIDTPRTDGLHSHGDRRLRYDSDGKNKNTSEERGLVPRNPLLEKIGNIYMEYKAEKDKSRAIGHVIAIHKRWPDDSLRIAVKHLLDLNEVSPQLLKTQVETILADAVIKETETKDGIEEASRIIELTADMETKTKEEVRLNLLQLHHEHYTMERKRARQFLDALKKGIKEHPHQKKEKGIKEHPHQIPNGQIYF